MKRIITILLSITMALSTILCVSAEDESQYSKYRYVMILLTEKASEQVVNGELIIDLSYFKKYDIDITEIRMFNPEIQIEAKKAVNFCLVLGKDDSEYSAKVIETLKQDENFMIVETGGEKSYDNTKTNNPMKVTVKTKTVKYNMLKKAKQTIAPITVKKAKGKVSYKKLLGSKKLTLKSNGKIVVKKGTKKGTYTAKIKVAAKGNSKYKSTSKTVKVKIIVK